MDLPANSHSENNVKNHFLENDFRPQHSHALLEREQDFKWKYCGFFEMCCEQTAKTHAHRNPFWMRHHIEIGQTVCYEKPRQERYKS